MTLFVAMVFIWVGKVVAAIIGLLFFITYFTGHDDDSRYGAQSYWLRTRKGKGANE